MAIYNAQGIIYTRINANNTQLASSNLGDISGQSPTDVIEAPFEGTGHWSAVSGALITGSGTSFNTDFHVNDYLYYFDGAGVPILLGQIDSFGAGGAAATQITLKTTSLTTSFPGGTPTLASSYTLITNSESVYMRIPTGAATGGKNIPNFSVWRVSDLTNVPDVSKIERYSDVGQPVSRASTLVNIPFTFVTMNVFTQNTSGFFWPDSSFPTYVWIKITPQAGSSTAFNSQTMYKFTTDEGLQYIKVVASTTSSTLTAAGYSISTSVSGGPGTPVGN